MHKQFLMLAALLAALPAVAAEPGAALAGACQGCHGAGGHGGHAMPTLAPGRDAAALAAQLREFRANTREATVMGRIARGYTDDEIAAIAAYWAAAR